MSEITLNFRLTTDDIVKYNNITGKRLYRIISIVFFAVAMFYIVDSIYTKTFSAVITAAFLVLFLVFVTNPVWSKYLIRRTYKNNFMLRQNTAVLFYQDHIVEKSDSGSKIVYEEHFPLEAIKSIIESKEHYLLFISPVQAIIIPKRAMNEEDKEKMKNLIVNIFSNRYKNINR